jgi:F-type H+-transporting ATPase subunit c
MTGTTSCGRILIQEKRMRTKLMWMFLVLALLCCAGPIFAQGSMEPAKGTPAANYHWVAITSGFSMAIASGLCGLAVAASAEGMARNPGAAAAIRFALLLGLVLIESLALYTLVIVFTQVK